LHHYEIINLFVQTVTLKYCIFMMLEEHVWFSNVFMAKMDK